MNSHFFPSCYCKLALAFLISLCNLYWQSNLKNVHCICSSQAYILLKDQLTKAKADVVEYQALYEKLQVTFVLFSHFQFTFCSPFFQIKKEEKKGTFNFSPFQIQVEKESLYWREKESFMKNELVDVLQQSSAVANSRISDLEAEIERYNKEKDLIEVKLDEASKEPGMESIFYCNSVDLLSLV